MGILKSISVLLAVAGVGALAAADSKRGGRQHTLRSGESSGSEAPKERGQHTLTRIDKSSGSASPEEPKGDHYKVLGVGNTAKPVEIREAYLKLVKDHHPDRRTGDTGKFQEVNTAYKVLSNKEQRKVYDEELKRRRVRAVVEMPNPESSDEEIRRDLDEVVRKIKEMEKKIAQTHHSEEKMALTQLVQDINDEVMRFLRENPRRVTCPEHLQLRQAAGALGRIIARCLPST